MIPWFQFTSFQIGFVTIQVWGLFVAMGILVATWVAARRLERHGIHAEEMWNFSFWVIVSAMIGARIFHMVYEPALFLAQPLEFFRVWHGGFSEMGGFLGALIPTYFFWKKHKTNFLVMADCAAFALPLGFGVGRIGCFLIHDHPGTLTHFMLGVKYPDGIRHDHGLYLAIEGFLLFLLFVLLDKKQARPGTFVIAFFALHGIVRFFLDFLRINDVRYAFLTPAQFTAVGMVIGAGVFWNQFASKKQS